MTMQLQAKYSDGRIGTVVRVVGVWQSLKAIPQALLWLRKPDHRVLVQKGVAI